jgi:hypothetical protein
MTEKKTHTLKEVDQLNHLAEREGFMLGMVEGHRIFYNVLGDIKMSFENMWSIYTQGFLSEERKKKMAEIQLVLDTLTHFEDVYQDRYDTAIDNSKDPMNYDELLAEHDLGDWRDSIASLKEEWPL